MARTSIKVEYKSFEEAKRTINTILFKKRFKPIIENGESVFRKGDGFWTAARYIKVEYGDNNTVTLSGWIKPFGSSAEFDLTGFVGAMPKKQIADTMSLIKISIE